MITEDVALSDEGTVLKYGVTVTKIFDDQEKFKPEILRFCSRDGLLTSSKLVLHQKIIYEMMRATNTAGRISTLIFVASCDNLNNQIQFSNILKTEVLL